MTQTLIQVGHRALPQRGAISAGDDAARLLHALTATLPSNFAPLSEIALEAALGAMADATKAAIAADLACFKQWCAVERRTAFPTAPEDLVRYILFLDGAPKKPATIARRLASIARAHRMLGFGMAQALPTQAGMVKDALSGVRRRRGTAQRQAAPMRLGKRDIVAYRAVEQPVFLKDHADLSPEPARIDLRQIDAIDEHATTIGNMQPLHELGKRRFA